MTWTRKYPGGWTNTTSTPMGASALNNYDQGLIDAHAELDGRLSEEYLTATIGAAVAPASTRLPRPLKVAWMGDSITDKTTYTTIPGTDRTTGECIQFGPTSHVGAALLVAGGAFLTAYDSGDGVHPNERGAKLIGEMVAAAILKDLVGTVTADLAQVGVGVSNLLYTNPLFLTKQGNGIPTGFVALSSFGSTVHDCVDVPGIPGKVFKITRGDASTNIATGNVLHVAGRRYRLAYRIRRTATDTYQQYNPKIEAVDGTFIACAVTTWPSAEFITVVHEYVLPAGLATYNYRVRFPGPAVAGETLEIAQFTWQDLTSTQLLV